MASPPAYRIAEPIIASSSPSHAGLDSSPPPPPSTPPPRSSPLGGFDDDSPSFLVARSPPPNDPYSAHNNATPSQHPSFGKQYPHVKHPSAKRTTKRSLPVSPNLPQGASTVAGPSSRPVSSSSRRTAGDRRAGVSSSSNGYGSSSSSDAQGSTASRRHRNQVLGNFFSADSSEAEAPTSDDQLEIVPWSQPGSDAGETSSAGVGLGLGSSFQEQGSPTSSRRRLPGASSLQRKPISRSSSVTDPFGAYQSPSSGMRDPRPPLYQNAPSASSPRQPRPQRRRLTGTSPRSRRGAESNGNDSSEDEGINALVNQREKESSSSHLLQEKKMSDYWHNLVEKVYESEKNTSIDAADQQITSIHPVVADLANYVAIEPPRSFEPTSSTSSLPLPSTSSAAFSRHATATSRAPFGRTATSTADSPLAGTPIEAPTARGSSRGKLQLFLNGNQLTRLPSALFEVGNLRVLSLWKNGLTELPPAIGDLQNLRELNVASNQLKWLPAEMLKLRLDRFHHFPNAFVKPTTAGAGEAKMETRAVLSITGALLASQAEEDEDGERMDAHDDDAMEADFLASQPTILTPLAPTSPGRGLMGPPPLPIRGGAALVAGPSNAALAAPRRVFDRTRSDAQVADLLSRGGGSMINRGGTSSSSSSSSSGATALPPVPPSPPQQDADGDEAMLGGTEQPAPRQATTSSISGAAQRSRVLGPLEYVEHIERLGPLPLPSLRELTIRRLLSPYEDEPDGGGDDSIATVVPNGSASPSSSPSARRQIVWSRVPSSSSAYQYKYSNGRRPTSVLEHYEPGALRELRAQMQRPTIAALEAARRTMEGKWGSRSGITGLGGVTTRSADSWCSGVAGKEVREEGHEEEDGDEADASSSSEGEAPRPSRTRSTSRTGGPSGVMDVSNELDTQGDDASLNPYFNRCPNPRHAQTHALSSQAGGSNLAHDGLVDYPLSPATSHFAPIFGKAMEQRLEWVSHIGGVKVATANATTTGLDEMGLIPVMWRGCKRGCLSFLEDAM